MTTQTNNPAIPGIAGAAISQYRLLKMDTDPQEVIHCTATATDVPMGVSQNAAAEGEAVTVRLLSAGTCKVTAGEAVSKGAKLYAAASGKVVDTASTGRFVGFAMEDASGDGSVIQMLPAGEAGSSFDQADLAAATATTALTVSTGGAASTTLAAGTNTTSLTDNGGGTADNTVAALTNTTSLTDNGGGTADNTVQAQSTFAASVGWNGSSVYPSAADEAAITAIALAVRNNLKEVTTQLALQFTFNATMKDNLKEVTTQLALQRTLNGVLLDAITSLGTEYNKLRADFADLRAKGVTAGLWLT